MNVNQKGVRGLIKVIDDLQTQGFYTFPAFDDHAPVDLIAMNDMGTTFRLQVKYRGDNTNLRTYSVVNGKMVPINFGLIDGWAIYLATVNRVVYVHKSHIGNRKFSFKLFPDKDYGWLGEWFIPAAC
jgi:hypothetical protein